MNLKYIISLSFLSVSIVGSLIGGLVYYFTNKPFYNQLEFSGVSDNKTLFMHIDSNNINYDIIEPLFTNNNSYILTRFFLFQNIKATLSQTIVDNNFNKLTNWDILEIDNLDNNKFIYLSNNEISIKINGFEDKILINNKVPVSFNNFPITLFSFDKPIISSLYESIKSVPNPTQSDLDNDIDFHSSLPPKNINPKCLIDLSYQAMLSGDNLVKYGFCNNYEVVALGGTNFKNYEDIWSDVVGAVKDNYKTGFNNLKNFDFKQHQICTGYSLGGAIAKYMAINNYCQNVITFGTPLTRDYKVSIPIIQYITVIDDDEGCCKRNWLGQCILKGMFLADPVSLILTGNHNNVQYIGNNKNKECLGNFAYTVFRTKFNLHLISTYQQFLPDVI